MFGWFRKRPRHDSAAVGEASVAPSSADAAEPDHGVHAGHVVAQGPASPHPVVPAPSLRPAMPLSDHPNFAGLGLAQPDLTPPRLLDPEAALSDEARHELTGLLLDMFGPRGRYRLEWRADRQPGDDAMFSQIMVADLVRRIQNTIAVASELELRATPLPLAIEEAGAHPSMQRDADDLDDDLTTEARDAAIAEFLSPAETLEQLAAAAHPEPSRPDTALPHHDTHDVEGDRRIA